MSLSYNSSVVNKIITDFQKGKKTDSINQLNSFLVKHPSDNVARYNLALMYQNTEKINLAIKNYNEIIRKDKTHWRSRFNLYLILIKQKKFEDALVLVDEVLKIKNNYQPALRDKALIFLNLKKPDEGIKYIIDSLKQNSQDFIALNTLGMIYLELKKIQDAEKIFKKVIEANPEYISTYNNLGRCYSLQYKRDLALKYYKIVLDKDPNHLDALNNIANHYSETGYYKKALSYYFKALKIDKKNNELLFNIGCAYAFLKDYKKSEDYYKRSYTINPENNKLSKNYSILLLALQQYKEAWEMHDGRLKLDEFKVKNDHIHNTRDKLWNGEKLDKNKTILVIKEQGAGDEILYASMYPDLLKNLPRSKIETDPRLISLFERSFDSLNNFVPYNAFSKNEESLKDFDFVIYAGSLGRLYRNNIKDFPKKHFLFSDKKKDNIFKKKLARIDNKKKIGISWYSKNENYGSAKSLDLKMLVPLFKLQDYTFINLQYGDTKKEIKSFYRNYKINIINFEEVDLFNDFEAISSLLINLDLLISVSNTTAHIAGALGVPTWLIKPKNHAVFHYWNQPYQTTPWYSSIRLYPYLNGWEQTIEKIKKDLIKKN